MKVLVATALTQGTRPSDVMRCVDGEFVALIAACPASRRNPYGRCDCGITFRGLSSGEVTTTAVVREVPGMGLDIYVDCLDASHRLARAEGCTCEADALAEAWNLLAIAGTYPVGTVVERCVDRVSMRSRDGRPRSASGAP